MMNRRRNTSGFASVGFVAAFLVLAVTLPAAAQTAGAVPAAGANPPMGRLLRTPYRPLVMQLRGVKLTPEQRQQVAAVLKAHRPEMKAQAEKARTVRQGWQQAGKIDIQERKNLMEQRMALMQPVRTEILNLLTPEQRAQIEARRFKRQR